MSRNSRARSSLFLAAKSRKQVDKRGQSPEMNDKGSLSSLPPTNDVKQREKEEEQAETYQEKIGLGSLAIFFAVGMLLRDWRRR